MMRALIFAASMMALLMGAATLAGCSVAKCVVHSDRCN
jgi:hypothetical protein